jgi:hypothetical protein
MEAEKQEQFPQLESAVDQAIAACDGDVRATVRSLIIANSYLTRSLSTHGNWCRPDTHGKSERRGNQPGRTRTGSRTRK